MRVRRKARAHLRAISMVLLLAAAHGLGPGRADADVSHDAGVQTTSGAPVRPTIRPTRAARPPAIDGVLDDEVWQSGPVETGEFLSYNPLHGSSIPQTTTVWMSYDADYLYFAFKCDDPDPSGIKTSVTRRDNVWQDDWVGLSLDALGTGQLSYHLMVNPSGVQLDMLNSVAGNEDTSPDWIWDSASRLTDTGYTAEIRLPLQSIRLKGGDNTRMGILFWRRVSRLGVSVSWPPLDPGAWVFERHANLHFESIQPRLVRELLPSVTYGRTTLRDTPSRWGEASSRSDAGFSAKIGLTSTITLDATVNPDFSQVESDAFQVEVNQRFPVFFGEKRPFFMEGAGIFALAGAGSGDNTLRTAVHTRRIIDPKFGAKVTGSAGRVTFGTLSAVDETGEDHRLFNIGRAQISLGPSNYVGALYADVTSGGTHNRVAGADLRWRVDNAQRIDAFVLASNSRFQRGGDTTSGIGAQVNYSYSTRRFAASGSFEHYDRDFRMDTAFMNRVGVTGAWGYTEYNFYPDNTRHPWLRRVTLFSFSQGGRDEFAGGREFVQVAGTRINFSRQGFLRVDRIWGFEHWAGQRFTRGRPRAFGNVQLFHWLALDAGLSAGHAVFYDSTAPFQGRSFDYNAGMTLQPSGRLAQRIGYQRVAFDRAATRERVYTLDIINTRTTYQFTRALALRGIAQYDSARKRVLTDFLGSYEPRPGTVVYAGYGALIEQRDFIDGQWIAQRGDFLTTQRGLFFKASYLYRF
jgi:hypothetical protein